MLCLMRPFVFFLLSGMFVRPFVFFTGMLFLGVMFVRYNLEIV